MHPGGWWFGGDCNVGGRGKARKIGSRLYITLYSLPRLLLTGSWVATLRATNSMGWLVWPILIKLASSGCSWQAWVMSSQRPVPSLLPCQQGHLSVEHAGRVSGWRRQMQWPSHALGLAVSLPFFLLKNNLIISENRCGPKHPKRQKLKMIHPGYVGTSRWFIPPLGGALQSKHFYSNT